MTVIPRKVLRCPTCWRRENECLCTLDDLDGIGKGGRAETRGILNPLMAGPVGARISAGFRLLRMSGDSND